MRFDEQVYARFRVAQLKERREGKVILPLLFCNVRSAGE